MYSQFMMHGQKNIKLQSLCSYNHTIIHLVHSTAPLRCTL